MLTTLYVNLHGAWPPEENAPSYVEIARWDGANPAVRGDLVTFYGPGSDDVTVEIGDRRWGIQRDHRGRSLELYGRLVLRDGSDGSFFPTDVRRIVRAELSAAGFDPESIVDVLDHPH